MPGSDRKEKRGGGARARTRGFDSPLHAARWEIRFAWLLRALILLTAIVHAVQGAWLYVLLCLTAIALVVVPAWMARSSAANLPVEIELVLLWWLVADMTLGRLAALYDTSAWFDKALHLGNSVLLGMLGFLAVYVLHFTGKFPAGKIVSGVIIVVLTPASGLSGRSSSTYRMCSSRRARRVPRCRRRSTTPCGTSFSTEWVG